jgi:tetratricopeptide (TPR) repeat protein/DNA-binding XRE family transcriptional regulator
MSEVRTHPSAADAPSTIGKATSGRRGRRKGVDIKPGTARQARLEAGLSLGQVAGTEISRTAIYFVETGKAKPSMETLKLIASRTGRPLDFFLSRPSTMEARSSAVTAEIERLITAGDAAGALAAGEAQLVAEHDDEIAARIKFHMATAHLRLAQAVQARMLASSARAHFEQAGDLLMVAECLGSEAAAAYLMQDPSAIALAEGALATCRSLKPVPTITESRLLAVLGGVYATNHNWEAAIKAYEQAIEAGEVVQDLRRLSLSYSGLSIAYQELGNLNQAAQYARRAMAIHETLNDRVSLARSENNLGLMLLQGGDSAKARPHIERSVRLFEQDRIEAGKAGFLLSLSELALAESRVDEAADFANRALELASRLSEESYVADAHVWLGLVSAALGDHNTVDAEFAAAFSVLEKPGASPERSSRAHAHYAEILEARGEMAGAVQHLKKALGSRASQMASDSRAATA